MVTPMDGSSEESDVTSGTIWTDGVSSSADLGGCGSLVEDHVDGACDVSFLPSMTYDDAKALRLLLVCVGEKEIRRPKAFHSCPKDIL